MAGEAGTRKGCQKQTVQNTDLGTYLEYHTLELLGQQGQVEDDRLRIPSPESRPRMSFPTSFQPQPGRLYILHFEIDRENDERLPELSILMTTKVKEDCMAFQTRMTRNPEKGWMAAAPKAG